jgi:hypothetical protein
MDGKAQNKVFGIFSQEETMPTNYESLTCTNGDHGTTEKCEDCGSCPDCCDCEKEEE